MKPGTGYPTALSRPKPARRAAACRDGVRAPIRSTDVPAATGHARHATHREKEAPEWVDCSGSSTARADDLRRLRPHLPQCRAAGRDRRRAPARGRQLRPDPVAATAGWCPTTSTSSCRGRPRAAGAVRHGAGRASSPSSSSEHADAAVLRLHRPGPDRLRAGRRPDHRPVPGAQQGAGRGERARPATDTQVRRARAVLEVNGTRHPLQPPGPRDRPRHRGRPAHQRPRRHPRGTPRSASTRAAGRQRRPARSRSTTWAPPTASWSTARRSQQATLRDGCAIQIGNTTMVVRAPSRRSARCLS